jgi:hypothetical protein
LLRLSAQAFTPEVPGRRLNLSAIEASLRAVQQDFVRLNATLSTPRDPFSDEVLANLLAGYACVDDAIAQGLDLFALGNSRRLLELNIRVLCGPGEKARRAAASHIAATERRFYEQPGGGIRDLMHWLSVHTKDPVWRRAAGAYVRILSQPQLYLEGNHRTGALIMSYILARDGRPPFVLTLDNAKAYFDPSALVKGTKKRGVAELTRLPKLKKRFAKLLEAQSDDAYLLPASPSTAEQRAASDEARERPDMDAFPREAS